jgi:CHRD domain
MRSGKKMGIIGGIASLAVVAAVVVAGPVFARESGKGSGKANVFVGKMTGGMEVPPAEPTATARAVITLKPSSDTVCFRLHWDGLTSVTAAHIHSGAAGVTGSVVVPFFNAPIPDTITSVGGCVHDVDPALIKNIHDNPSGYYVNVHDAAYPGGAVRDQLHPAGKHDDD